MRRFILMLMVALVATACGGAQVADRLAEEVVEQAVEQAGDDEIDLEIESTDDGEMTLTVEGEDGVVQGSFGGELPADFPFPLPDEFEVGMNLVAEEEQGTSYVAIIEVQGDQFEAMREMYLSWLEAQNFEVETFDYASSAEAKATSLTGARDDVMALIDISIEEVSNDAVATVISLSWMPRE